MRGEFAVMGCHRLSAGKHPQVSATWVKVIRLFIVGFQRLHSSGYEPIQATHKRTDSVSGPGHLNYPLLDKEKGPVLVLPNLVVVDVPLSRKVGVKTTVTGIKFPARRGSGQNRHPQTSGTESKNSPQAPQGLGAPEGRRCQVTCSR